MRTAPTGQISSLIGIRGVLAALVLAIHLGPLALGLVPATTPVWTAIWHAGYPALDVFFVLSGFVVTTGYGRRFASWPGRAVYGRFLLARLSRFYPLHLAVLAVLVMVVLAGQIMDIAVPHRGGLGIDLLRHVLLVQGWGAAPTLTWNGPSWSLSAEWLCYLVFPLVMPVLARIRRPVAGYVLACAVPLVAYAVLGFDDAMITYRAPLFRAAGAFVAGAMLCRMGQVGSRLPALAGRFTGPIVTASVVALGALYAAGLPPLLVMPLAGLVVLALAQQRGLVDRVLASRPLLRAGDVSVALYLTHVPWLMAASTVITPARFPGAWGWVGIALYVAGAVVVAAVALVLVERPGQALLRRIGRPRSPRVVAAAPHLSRRGWTGSAGHPDPHTAGRRAAAVRGGGGPGRRA